jgi:hypothetical protein
MSSGRGARLLLCLAAALAVVGLHAHGDGTAAGPSLSGPDHVIAVHGDIVAGTVALRTESFVQDETKRPTKPLVSVFALGACAIALLAVGHHRRVSIAGATRPGTVRLLSSSPRAPPLRLS